MWNKHFFIEQLIPQAKTKFIIMKLANKFLVLYTKNLYTAKPLMYQPTGMRNMASFFFFAFNISVKDENIYLGNANKVT